MQVLRLVEAKKVVSWHFYATRIMPVGFFMAATLHFGNLVYLYLTVSFIQMLKVRWVTPVRYICDCRPTPHMPRSAP